MPITVMFFLICVTLTIGYILYLWITSRHKEKMAIIEKGGDFTYPERKSKYPSLKWGLVLLCFGLALTLGIYSDIANNHDGPFFTLPAIVIGAGFGLLLYYFIVLKIENSSKDNL